MTRNPAPKYPSRQAKRYLARKRQFAKISRDFGGTTSNGHYWPEGMNRRQARSIAFDMAKAEGQ